MRRRDEENRKTKTAWHVKRSTPSLRCGPAIEQCPEGGQAWEGRFTAWATWEGVDHVGRHFTVPENILRRLKTLRRLDRSAVEVEPRREPHDPTRLHVRGAARPAAPLLQRRARAASAIMMLCATHLLGRACTSVRCLSGLARAAAVLYSSPCPRMCMRRLASRLKPAGQSSTRRTRVRHCSEGAQRRGQMSRVGSVPALQALQPTSRRENTAGQKLEAHRSLPPLSHLQGCFLFRQRPVNLRLYF